MTMVMGEGSVEECGLERDTRHVPESLQVYMAQCRGRVQCSTLWLKVGVRYTLLEPQARWR